MELCWREKTMNVISSVIETEYSASSKKVTENQLRKAFRKAYPFGERKCLPYKTWCEQVNKTLAYMFPRGKSFRALFINQMNYLDR